MLGKIETGISSFDKISGGGLISPSALSLIGNIGSIKETFVRHIAWNFLQRGLKVLYYSVSQSAEDLRSDMARFNWDVTPYEKEGFLHIEDIFTSAAEKVIFGEENSSSADGTPEVDISKELYDFKIIAKAGMKFMPAISGNSKSKLIVFDSISPVLQANSKGIFQMLHQLKFAARLTKAIGIGLMHTGVHDPKIEENFKSLGDGIIEIVENPNGSNTLSLPKYVGEYKRGPFPIEVNNKGINIFPIVMIDFPQHEYQVGV